VADVRSPWSYAGGADKLEGETIPVLVAEPAVGPLRGIGRVRPL